MKILSKNTIDDTIKYFVDSGINKEQLLSDPENVIFESGLDLNDKEYCEAIDYIKTLS